MFEMIKGYIDALIYLLKQLAALLGIEFGGKEEVPEDTTAA